MFTVSPHLHNNNMGGIYKVAVEMGSIAKIHRQHGDLMSLVLCFESKESRLTKMMQMSPPFVVDRSGLGSSSSDFSAVCVRCWVFGCIALLKW
jgi:hypothetical protein